MPSTMSKRNGIIYWVATVWLALGLTSTAVVQIFQLKTNGPGSLENVVHMGFPADILLLLGVWKLLGVVALLIPRSPLLKEWAYAGIFFTISGALYFHVRSGDGIGMIAPVLLYLVLIAASWYFRPADRRLIPARA
jgi:hypothetical protein